MSILICRSGRTRYRPCTWVWPLLFHYLLPPLFPRSSDYRWVLRLSPFPASTYCNLTASAPASLVPGPPSSVASQINCLFSPLSTLSLHVLTLPSPSHFHSSHGVRASVFAQSRQIRLCYQPQFHLPSTPSKALQTIRVELGDCGLCPRPTTHNPQPTRPQCPHSGLLPPQLLRVCCVCLRKVSVVFVAPPILRLILRRSAIASSP